MCAGLGSVRGQRRIDMNLIVTIIIIIHYSVWVSNAVHKVWATVSLVRSNEMFFPLDDVGFGFGFAQHITHASISKHM